MDVSGTLTTPSAAPLRRRTVVRASFPNAGFWMGLVILTMTIRQVALWELGEGMAHGRIGDMVLLLVIGLWFGGRCLIGRFAIVRNRLDLTVLIFLMFYITSILWADNVEAGWIRLLKLLRNGMLYLLLVDYLSANFSIRYRKIAICLLATGLLQSLAFAFSISQQGGLAALGTLLQADSIQSNDPILGVVRQQTGAGLFLQGVASWLPLCMFVGFSIHRSIRSQVLRLGNWVLICGMGVLTLLSATRAAMVGLAVGLMTICALRASHITMRRAIGGGVAVLVLLPGTLYFNLHTFIMSRMSLEVLQSDASTAARFSFLKFAFDRYMESPWLGVGVANIFPDGITAVHNVYAQVLGEVGVLGGAIFLWMLALWVYYLISAWKLASKIRDSWTTRVAVSLLGFSGFLFTYFLVGHDLGSSEPWIVMGMTSALYNRGAKAHSKSGTERQVPFGI